MNNVMRSPTKTPKITIRDGNGSQSQPDLSSIDDHQSITFRKRKTPEDDYMHQFDQFKGEIMEVLKSFTTSQNQNMQTIIQNISSINSQLADIKSTTDSLAMENNMLKTEIAALKSSKTTTDETISNIQNDLQQLKSVSNLQPVSETQCATLQADILAEMEERSIRDKNIVIAGIPESLSTISSERQEHDKGEISKIISAIFSGCLAPKPLKIIRLGKIDAGKTRPIKVCFDSATTAKEILKNRSKVDAVKIYSDQSPYQQKFVKNLREELQKRTQSGENDLTIKYTRGVPKIVKIQPKNSHQVASQTLPKV